MGKASSLTDIVETIQDAQDGDTVSAGKIIDAFGHRGFGALITLAALLALSPVGAIPGASVILASLLILLAGQLAFGREQPWIPDALRNLTVKSDRIDKTVEKLRPWTSKADQVITGRFKLLTSQTAIRTMAVAVVLLALSFIPVIVVPWGVVLPGLIILLFAVAIMVGDGLSALMGWLLCPLWLWAFWQFSALAA